MIETDTEFRTLNDGCGGDTAGLLAAVGTGYVVLHEECDDQGWGHHQYDAIIQTAGGRIVHAECGGCSCEGSGSWSYCESYAAALLLIPEWRRDRWPQTAEAPVAQEGR